MKKTLLLSAALVLGLTACSGGAASSVKTGTVQTQTSVQNDVPGDGPASSEAGIDAFSDAPTVKMQFAENQPSTSSVGINAEEFCKKVAERTGNTVQIEFYGDALLGDEASVIGGIEAGTIEFTRVNASALQATVPEVGVLTLPYLYKDNAHCYRVLNSDVGDDLLARCQDHGFVGLRLSGGNKDNKPSGFRSFYAATPINSVADLKGKKIRVQESEVVIKMVEALGGVATPMAYGEVFQALQTGVIDIAENDPSSYYQSGHYEVAKYYTRDNHQLNVSMYIMSQKAYDAMTEAQRTVFLECLDEYLEKNSDDVAVNIEEFEKKAVESGCEFIDVDTASFQEACQSVYDMFPDYSEMLERIRAID